MHGKIFLISFILIFIFYNVMAQENDNASDDDEEFDNYKANLINAVQTLNKNLNSRDARDLQRRGWLKNLWNNVVKPVLTNAAVKIVAGAIGKRTSEDNEALSSEARALNRTECLNDVAKFKEVKKAASQLCALAEIPEFKCH